MKKLLFIIILISLTASNLVANVSINVTGKVVDENNESLPGVTISLQGTSLGTITDIDGNFSLNINQENPILVFSFIGYESQVVPVTSNILNIQMLPDVKMLDEVIVVGYGTQRKGSVTGSVAQVDSREILRAPVGAVSTMVSGRLPGMVSKQAGGEPGNDGASLNIRGVSSFASSNSPVIIVDGIRRSLDNLDPQEIESVTILKDASAAAVYGLRAAAGVILVTTKTGSIGKPRIKVTSNLSLSKNTLFPEFLDGPEYAYWYNLARKYNNGLDPLFSNEQIELMINGDPEGKWGNTNWVDEVMGGLGETYYTNISVDGGSENIKYFFTGGYYDQTGNIKNITFNRYNFRSNVNAKISDNFRITVGLGGRKQDKMAPTFSTEKNSWNNIFQQAMRTHPYLPKTYQGYYTGNQVNGPIVSALSAIEESGYRNNQSAVFQSNISINWDLPWVTEGLSFGFTGSYDYTNSFAKAYQIPHKIAQGVVTANGINYSIVESSIGTMGQLAESSSYTRFITLNTSVNYQRKFGKHDFAGLFLYEQFQTQSNAHNVTARGFDFIDLDELNYAQEIHPGSGAYGGTSNIVPSAGYIGRINYGFDNKYLLEVSGRYDGSYKFIGDNRWTLFPAASVGWVISEEDFFREALPSVSNLKLRASVGKLGNDTGIGSYIYMSTLGRVENTPSTYIGSEANLAYRPNTLPNPDLRWETATTYNIGFETHLWNDLLGIEFDYFYKLTEDILESQGGLFPPSVGGYFPSTVNSGRADNRGFELVLSHNNKVGDLHYGARFNISWHKNRYLSVNDSPNIQSHLLRNGRPLGQKHGLVALGIFQTDEEAQNWPSIFGDNRAGDIKYLDVNGDGRLTYQDDRMWIADSNVPKLFSNLNLYAEFKGFDFSALFQGAALAEYALSGNYPGIGYDNTEFTTPFFQRGNAPKYLVENMWTPENRDAKYPRLSDVKVQNNKWASTLWIVDGSYLRLKNIQVGYTIPKTLISKLGLDQLRIYTTGGNLFTLTEFKYMDPEAPDVSNGFYPQQKIYSFGVELTF